MNETRIIQKLLGIPILVLTLLSGATASGQNQLLGSRSKIEAELEKLRTAYEMAPGDTDARRAYAATLFKLGNVWQANDVIAPLALPDSTNEFDLKLGARVALLTMDLTRAEKLFKRLAVIAKPGSYAHAEAMKGLVMVYYQSEQFEKTKGLSLPAGKRGTRSQNTLLKYQQAFEGKPYQMIWGDREKVAHLPFTNDVNKPGALPEVKITVNGQVVLLTLDTGGDRLYLDVSVAEKAGIRGLVVNRAKYAYTKGKLVDEPWGVANKVELGGVTLKNVPAVIAQWKANGPTTDGVIGTAILKHFLSTIDYKKGEITLRPRGEAGMSQFRKAMGDRALVRMPFFMTSTHLMFAKGQINGHRGMNMFLDSGLAASMPMIIVNETAELLKLKKNDIKGTPYFWSPLESHGLHGLEMGAAQALGNVFVEGDNYRSQGFFWDALISHQYLRKLGSWTIDFDTMSYYFPRPKGSRKPSKNGSLSE